MNRGFWIWAVNALNESELKARTKRFGLRVMKLVDALPNTMAGRGMGSQLRQGAAYDAHYLALPVDGSVVAEREYRGGRGYQTDIDGALREHV